MATTIISGNMEYAQLAYDVTLKLAGGAENYSQHTLSAIWMECLRNNNIQRLAGMYLAGSSERAEKNLKALREEIYNTFIDRVRA
jgi:hypothetical protein